MTQLSDVVKAWWRPAGLTGPFTPGETSGNNDGRVRDCYGRVVADCGGNEACADVIAALLNAALSAYREELVEGGA